MPTTDLIEQNIAIDLGFGIDTKTAKQLVINSKLLRLENAVIQRRGQVDARPGTVSLPNVDTSGLTLGTAQALAQFNDELLEVAGGNLYSFNLATATNWSKKATLTPVGVQRRVQAQNLASLNNVNAASLNGVTVYAWDTAGGSSLNYQVVDEASGTIYLMTTLLAAQTPIFVISGSKIVLLFGNGSNQIQTLSFNTTTPWAAPTSAALASLSLLSQAAAFGAVTDGTTLFVAATNASGGITIATYTLSTLAFVTSTTIASFNGGLGASFISVMHLPTTTSGVSWGLCYAYTGNLVCYFYSTNLLTVLSSSQQSGAQIIGPCCLRQSATIPDKCFCYATVYGPGPSYGPLGSFTGTAIFGFAFHISSGTRYSQIFPNDLIVSGATLESMPWDTGLGTTSILVEYCIDPTVQALFPANAVVSSQPTYFVLDADTGAVVARGVPGQALTPSTSSASPTVGLYTVLPVASNLGSNRFLLGLGANLVLQSQGSNFVFGQGVTEMLFDYGASRPLRLTQLGQNSHISLGALSRYDGITVAEHGFNVAPEFLLATGDGTSLIDVQFLAPTTTTNSVTTVTFPTGLQIAPGEWWAYDNSGLTWAAPKTAPTDYFWYTVNGTGVDPAPLPSGGHVVAILSSDTSQQVAQKTLAVINNTICLPNTGANNSIASLTTQNGLAVLQLQGIATIGLTGGVVCTTIPPVQQGRFRVFLTAGRNNQYGGGTEYHRAYLISCIPGSMIQPGQYFQLNLGRYFTCYVWFKVSGVGSDPQTQPTPTGTLPNSQYGATPVECDIFTSDTAAQVATKILAALTANANITGFLNGTVGPASVVTGNFVFINSSQLNSAADNSPELGANVNVGAGELGLPLGAGTSQPAVYQYVAVYAETDARGQIHRSAPSVPLTVTCPRSPQNDSRVVIKVPGYRISNKGSAVFVELYRTVANASTFYKVSPSIPPVANANPAPVVFHDTLQDARPAGDTQSAFLTTNEPLYTTGGALPHDTSPPFAGTTSHRGRLWGWGIPQDPLTAWYTAPQVAGYGLSWSAKQTMTFPPAGGAITAIATMDEKLIVFKESQIFFTSGDGPDATGANGSFIVPELISSEAGCINPKSVCLTPLGLVFQSAKGIYLLDRNSSVSYIGKDADAYNSLTITSATYLDTDNQARFTTLTGPTIVCNFVFLPDGTVTRAWGIHTNTGMQDSLVYAPHVPGQTETRVFYQLSPDGKVHKETPGVYADDGVGYSVLLQTAWIKLKDIQGFGRIRKALWLGYWPSTQQSTLLAEYNYVEGSGDTETMNLTVSGTNSLFYGSGAYYGADPSWGGPAISGQDIIQWRAFIKNQKVEAIRLTLQTVAPFRTDKAISVVSLQLAAAVKRGAFKLPATQSIGS